MTSPLNAAYKSLQPEAQAVYDAIFEPVVVGTPPTFAARNLCVTANGEIRHYGWRDVGGRRLRVYIASRDLGLNWEQRFATPDEIASFMQSPFSDKWIALFSSEKAGGALCAARSKTGPGDPAPDILTLPWKGLELRQLLPLTHRRRWVAALSVVDIHSPDCYHAAVLLSDDDGRTWRRVDIPPVTDVPRLFPGDLRPHWFNNGCEPTVAELADGSLLLAVRTSGPHAAFYRSTDGGETWGTPGTRDCFWQSNTMPYLFRLSDGRLLFIWNNTASLPTRDAAEYPELGKDELNGFWEVVFTNRDALHAAISSDDGRTWRGFREIALTEPRNAADFRELGNGPFDEHDKSVHQTQALELPGGKVLLSYGQNPAARRLAIFDPDWLLETSRQEDFRHGLANISHHLYVNSLSGGYRGWAGHCAWNRVPGAVMSREPDAPEGVWRRESMLLARIRDPRLVSDLAGAVWNFPSMRRGHIEVECRVLGVGFRLSLLDHWINPCDIFNATRAPFDIFLDPGVTGADWCRVEVVWDCDAATARLLVDSREILACDLAETPEAGFSYLHLQASDKCEDADGTYFRSLHAEMDMDATGLAKT
jgi:hypothetical protein